MSGCKIFFSSEIQSSIQKQVNCVGQFRGCEVSPVMRKPDQANVCQRGPRNEVRARLRGGVATMAGGVLCSVMALQTCFGSGQVEEQACPGLAFPSPSQGYSDGFPTPPNFQCPFYGALQNLTYKRASFTITFVASLTGFKGCFVITLQHSYTGLRFDFCFKFQPNSLFSTRYTSSFMTCLMKFSP